jgi:ubiquinone/menaquinone biosynthesis C-methylase UbiE
MEVGSGRGEFTEALVRKGGPNRYYLVDMPQGMLDLAGECREIEQEPKVSFRPR